MSLYLVLLICSIIIPLSLSFDRKVAFYKHWPVLLPSILLTGLFFIGFDIYFARKEIWGFNPLYHSGILLGGLPLEELLFFVVIPYSSIFIHYVLLAYFPAMYLSDRKTRIISLVLIILLFSGILTNLKKSYSLVYFLLMVIVLLLSFFEKTRLMNRFYLSFIVILVPFILINGILTGSFIPEEVVWYNSQEITGIRILTIPVEDFTYGFILILINLLLMNYFRRSFIKVRKS